MSTPNLPPQTSPDTDPKSNVPIDSSAPELKARVHEDEAPYCILPEKEKVFLMLLCSFAAIISPISSSIYFPAIGTLAEDLHVSVSDINLTVTMYLIFQGLAPSIVASLSDTHGRRPAYLACFTIYIATNIALALQNSYAALMVLRCLQSTGSSGTIALSSATVSDLATRAERGKYIGFATMGVTLGPALGPVIGGLLSHFLGWRAIFWFLVILSGVLGATLLLFLPETCRAVVGNGSVPPKRWNRSIWQIIRARSWSKNKNIDAPFAAERAYNTLQKRRNRRNPLTASLSIATESKEAFIILIYGGLLFSGYMAILSTLTSELEARFNYNTIQIGLCYLPLGLGSLTSRWTVGTLLDMNFKREAKRQSLVISKNKQQDLKGFNIERARLAVTLPFTYLSCAFILGYGWVMQARTSSSIAGTLIFIFLSGHTTSGSFSSLNTLIVDTNAESPATAVAASNLFRCLMGAGAVAAATPLIERVGMGWMATLVAGVWVVVSPCLWIVYYRNRGHLKWEQLYPAGSEVAVGVQLLSDVALSQYMNSSGRNVFLTAP
ncbi:putative MFS transporter [Aspergillus stella-maris]|uniref:putative MFS transporter n=1 Tax=Aspergillus stella-maris TaxID=1810926 RepID=UPI003CCD9D93